MRCNLCNSERIMVSADESILIPGAHYCSCTGCGNVMIEKDNVLMPTPTDDNMLVKAMIEDASVAFRNNRGARLLAVSLNSADIQLRQQPMAVKQALADYVNQFVGINNTDEENDTDEEDFVLECDGMCEECEDGCPDFEERREEAVLSGTPVYEEKVTAEMDVDVLGMRQSTVVTPIAPARESQFKDYLILLPNGDKLIFKESTKDAILNTINDMHPNFKANIEVYELIKKELSSETIVNYTF